MAHNLFIDLTKKDTVAENIITEQTNIIEEYHKYLKSALDKNRQLEKELSYYKKEAEHASTQGVKSRNSSRKDTSSLRNGAIMASKGANQQNGKVESSKV